MSKGKQTAYRSSKTGQFVKPDYAKKHPDTTQRETNPRPKRKK